jgi:uncharacterized metal-binding protein
MVGEFGDGYSCENLSRMTAPEKMLVFLCSSTMKAGDKKLGHRIASRLEAMGIATIGSLQNLSEQHNTPGDVQKHMLFINDCKSSCVKVLMHGFGKEKFLFLDVSPFSPGIDFDVDHYIQAEVIPTVNSKWKGISISAMAIRE